MGRKNPLDARQDDLSAGTAHERRWQKAMGRERSREGAQAKRDRKNARRRRESEAMERGGKHGTT